MMSGCLLLASCNGGPVSGYSNTSNGSTKLGPFIIASPDPVTSPIPDSTSSPTPAADITYLTDIKIDNTTGSAQSNIPITFGHVFSLSNVPAGLSVTGKLSDNTLIALQANIKATHVNGSARHAVISAILPSLAANATETIRLYTSNPLSVAPVTAATFLSTNPGFSSRVYVRAGAEIYSASARSLLAGSNIQWLAGPTANEWIVSGPLLKTSDNVTPHPHLTVRFAIRSFTGSNKTKVDVTIENNKTFTAGAQNISYDSKIFVGGVEVDNIAGLTHFHHARWHKSFWWGNAPQTHIRHNIPYLIATKAVPNYDQSVVPSPTAISNMVTNIAGKTGPMKVGLVEPYMPTTGGRTDIGPMPGWYALYLLSMDKRAKEVMMSIADGAGSWPIHYRDETDPTNVNTYDMPVRLDKTGNGWLNVPYREITVHSNANSEGPLPVPRCGGDCTIPYTPDTAHQPSLVYLPYLVTGDYFYLEELHFWTAWNFLGSGASYRQYEKGLIHWEQVRAQGWDMRTLGQASYITPDNHPLKNYFNDKLTNNLANYNSLYTNNVSANQIGILNSFIGYTTNNGTNTGYAPWQDDFFTWSIGYLSELGFTDAQTFLNWKSKFVIGRMTDPGYCWTLATIYGMAVRDTETSPIYSTFSEAYFASAGYYKGADNTYVTSKVCGSQANADWLTANAANIPNVGVTNYLAGEMSGYSYADTGYPSNMQPALAVSVTNASTAWQTFINRANKPSYTAEPQFAVVPRN